MEKHFAEFATGALDEYGNFLTLLEFAAKLRWRNSVPSRLASSMVISKLIDLFLQSLQCIECGETTAGRNRVILEVIKQLSSQQ